ncbi:ubiquinone anaerobic biosynthesis protein UbiV [Rhodovibrio salinarum]|uniref:U32 family peptidase n=1 Tax=Rhodovibrio salinarum TaxID=1087 RepID=A0A934QFH3_9PROT|nr:U32 family peptidase [Rhodovibrio salinarum]MBK1695702.1 U32 family peptidase [Rhodovibrio salinarum]
MTQRPASDLTLGPLLLHWPGEAWRDFHFRIADEAPVDTVALGEVVCPKRWPFNRPYLDAVIDRLQRAGKRVMMSTPALVADDRDATLVRELAGHGLPVEVNDMAALGLLQRDGIAVESAGPGVNSYNEATLRHLGAQGVSRVLPPPELPRASLLHLAGLQGADAKAPAIEVQAFGRWPLAISARCYHARAYGRDKATCQFACGADPDGLPVDTLDDQPFLTVNGVQTLSRAYACLAGELDALRQAGVQAFRLLPQDVDMVAVAQVFSGLLEGREETPAALDALEELCGEVPLANGYLYDAPGVTWHEA